MPYPVLKKHIYAPVTNADVLSLFPITSDYQIINNNSLIYSNTGDSIEHDGESNSLDDGTNINNPIYFGVSI
jgi:hypothetical protein